MTPETLKYLKGVLTERILKTVEDLEPELGSSTTYAVASERFAEIRKTSQALNEVNRAIRRAENRAKRKQDRP